MSFGCFYLCFSSQDGRASLPDRLLFGIVSKTVLTVFLLLSGLRGLLGIFAQANIPLHGGWRRFEKHAIGHDMSIDNQGSRQSISHLPTESWIALEN